VGTQFKKNKNTVTFFLFFFPQFILTNKKEIYVQLWLHHYIPHELHDKRHYVAQLAPLALVWDKNGGQQI
jgi:hypothetical protein